jgi:hypothetical protein
MWYDSSFYRGIVRLTSTQLQRPGLCTRSRNQRTKVGISSTMQSIGRISQQSFSMSILKLQSRIGKLSLYILMVHLLSSHESRIFFTLVKLPISVGRASMLPMLSRCRILRYRRIRESPGGGAICRGRREWRRAVGSRARRD